MGKRARRQQAATMAEMNRMSQEQFEYFQAEKRAQQEVVDQQRQQYEAFDFQNPFEGVQNPYASLQTNFENLASGARNVYAGIENPYEDLTVNMRQAEFQAEQGERQRANILSNLRQAAGSTGIASLAQVLANQGVEQARKASIDIGEQEQANQLRAQREAGRLDQLEREGEQKRDLLERKGQAQVEEFERQKENKML
ncbi:MAG TPA: hypothetical protein DF712_14910 [Balneola sp.]|nr:hypothetical protein [Balneola sp.]